MNRTPKTHMILKALIEGPATSAELAGELQMDRFLVAAMLSKLHRQHRVTRSVFHRRSRGKLPFLYQISTLGLRRIGREVQP